MTSRWRDDPNPVWLRELRQTVRLQRTPIILAVITGMMTLLVASVGGLLSVTVEPAKIGVALFHVFFTLAFAVVTWVGPAVAASTIASERAGRTWEAVLLTGMPLGRITRGKFLAALTYISLYVVMLAPIGAMPFLFGGVTATEVFAAFAWMVAFGALAVAFGLAISSKFSSPAVAIIVTLIVAIPSSMVIYVMAGPILSIWVHRLWPAVTAGPPVWLPTAYARASFGWEYVVFLVAAPLTVTLLPTWLMYEVTLANLAGASDDRSTGVRRWFVVSAPLIALVCIASALILGDLRWSITLVTTLVVFLVVMAFIFAAEPLGPSRRVRVHWTRSNAGALTRYLGPGLLRAMSLLLTLGLGLAAACVFAGAFVAAHRSGWHGVEVQQIAVVGGYEMAYFAFISGFVAWTRARAIGAAVPRLLTLAALFVTAVGPWIAMAIAGVFGSNQSKSIMLAAPSPLYLTTMVDALEPGSTLDPKVILAGAAAAACWALLGTGLHGAAAARVRTALLAERASEQELDAVLAAEARLASTPAEPVADGED